MNFDEENKKDLAIDINGVRYPLDEEVFHLFQAISIEKDEYKDALKNWYTSKKMRKVQQNLKTPFTLPEDQSLERICKRIPDFNI